MLRTNTCGELGKKNAGEKVILSGWVEAHRIQGRISFILLRDRYGITQIFVTPKLTKKLGEIRRETVLQIKGEVQARPENQINKEFSTGEIEVAAEEINILNKADPLPLETDIDSTEQIRLKYRYLDLRTPDMQKNLLIRHKAIQFIRDYLNKVPQQEELVLEEE